MIKQRPSRLKHKNFLLPRAPHHRSRLLSPPPHPLSFKHFICVWPYSGGYWGTGFCPLSATLFWPVSDQIPSISWPGLGNALPRSSYSLGVMRQTISMYIISGSCVERIKSSPGLLLFSMEASYYIILSRVSLGPYGQGDGDVVMWGGKRVIEAGYSGDRDWN